MMRTIVSSALTTLKANPMVLAIAILAAGTGPAIAGQAAPGTVFPPLHVDCRGEPGPAPTVILQAGAFGTSADWDLVLEDLAQGGRACAFDRAGLGGSPARPGEKDVLTKAGELNSLLDQLGETRPVILVGHSNGALYDEAFAALWPGRVAGLISVNGVGADDLGDPRLMADLAKEARAADLAVTAGRLGLARVVAKVLTDQMSLGEAAARAKRDNLVSLARLKVGRDEDRAILPGLETTRRLGQVPPDIPVAVVISISRPPTPLEAAWRAAEIAPARRARRAWSLEMPGASHVSPLIRDRAYVRAAVDWLRTPLPDPDIGH